MVNNSNYSNDKYKCFCLYKDESPSPLTQNKELVINSGIPGSGKSYDIQKYVNEHPDKKFLIIAPRHALLDEYDVKLTNDHVVIKSMKDTCAEWDNDTSIEKLHSSGVNPYIICINRKCHGDCDYKERWKKVRDREGYIAVNICCTPEIMTIWNYQDFDGVFIDERCANSYDLEFDIEHILKNLHKIVSEGQMKQHIYDDIEKHLRIKDVHMIEQYGSSIDDMIYRYNVMICEKYANMNMRIKKAKWCLLRFSDVVAYLNFYNAMKHIEDDEKKREWEGMCTQAVREIAMVNCEISQLKIWGNKCKEVEGSEIAQNMNNEKIAELQEMKMQLFSNIANLAKVNNINSTFDTSFELEHIDDEYMFACIKSFRTHYRIADDVDAAIKVKFMHMLFYMHMNSCRKIEMADATLQFRQEYFLKDLMEFKQWFPEYKVKVTMKIATKESDSVIWIPSIITDTMTRTGNENRNEWNKNYRNILRMAQKQVKIGKNVCVITYMDKINFTDDEKDDGTIFTLPALYYKSAPGVNKWEDYNAVFVVCTWIPHQDELEGFWNEYYLKEHGKMPGFKWITNHKERTVMPSHPLVRDLFIKFILNGEIYNTLHRLRPANKQTDMFYCAYNIPPALKEEFKVMVC
ncbi:hypothetical protein [Methanolobus sp.]|uniref:hypothetical protein n=1 Tax=Methanolobus sp. TaxID=1874737 RepID=UPI0025CDFA2C|nr:hypothetical protein [Methanolobus sp.]